MEIGLLLTAVCCGDRVVADRSVLWRWVVADCSVLWKWVVADCNVFVVRSCGHATCRGDGGGASAGQHAAARGIQRSAGLEQECTGAAPQSCHPEVSAPPTISTFISALSYLSTNCLHPATLSTLSKLPTISPLLTISTLPTLSKQNRCWTTEQTLDNRTDTGHWTTKQDNRTDTGQQNRHWTNRTDTGEAEQVQDNRTDTGQTGHWTTEQTLDKQSRYWITEQT